MEPCGACQKAERAPRIHDFEPNCLSCKARALAAIGAGSESAELGKITEEFSETLDRMFGADREAGIPLVRAWITKMGKTK